MRGHVLLLAVGLNSAGVLIAFAGWMMAASLVLVAGLVTAVYALRLLEPTARPAKVKGVHTSFPVFVRLAYIWALIAGTLGIWAASVQNPHGIWGASRHALTVGFLATMVFAIGQRVLPAFSGMRLLFSTKLMFIGDSRSSPSDVSCASVQKFSPIKAWYDLLGRGFQFPLSLR